MTWWISRSRLSADGRRLGKSLTQRAWLMDSQGGDRFVWEGYLLLYLFKEITEHCISLDNMYMRFILVIEFILYSRGPSSLGIGNRNNLFI